MIIKMFQFVATAANGEVEEFAKKFTETKFKEFVEEAERAGYTIDIIGIS